MIHRIGARWAAGPAPSDRAADLGAGVVVALVALPLCLGIALASGAPLAAGLVSGAIGGLVISWAGGTSLLVSGPAAGLTVVVLAAVLELGFPAVLTATALAGVVQLGLGIAKAGRLTSLVPSSVVTGMLAAIGLLLVLQQTPVLLGAALDGHPHGPALLLLPFRALAAATPGPALVGLTAWGVLWLWDRPALRPLRRTVPGPLVAVVVGSAVASLLPWLAPSMALPADARVVLPDAGGPLGLLTRPDPSALLHPGVWKVALTLAAIASLETLLSMEATDRIDPLRRRSDGDRELLGQGLGNLLAGLLGGLPITGVIARSAANVEAGGRTWRAAFVHGVVLVVAVLAAPGLIERIPLAALAAILVHTGLRLAEPRRFVAAWHLGRAYFVPLACTVAAVVLTDLLIGVACGFVLSAFAALATNARYGYELRVDGYSHRVELASTLCFVHKPHLYAALQAIPPGAELTVDASQTRVIDPDLVELLHEFEGTARDKGIRYRLVNVPEQRMHSAH